MKSARKWTVHTWLFFLVLGCSGVLWAIPQSAMAQQSCSLATLKGTYIYEYEGFALVDGQHVPFAFAGVEYYNGDGTMRGVFSGTDDSSIDRDIEYTGTYTVEPDCTGTLINVDPISVTHFDQFLAPNGSKFTFVQTDEGFVASGVEKRVSRKIIAK
jgi:hypothetical protein